MTKPRFTLVNAVSPHVKPAFPYTVWRQAGIAKPWKFVSRHRVFHQAETMAARCLWHLKALERVGIAENGEIIVTATAPYKMTKEELDREMVRIKLGLPRKRGSRL